MKDQWLSLKKCLVIDSSGLPDQDWPVVTHHWRHQWRHISLKWLQHKTGDQNYLPPGKSRSFFGEIPALLSPCDHFVGPCYKILWISEDNKVIIYETVSIKYNVSSRSLSWWNHLIDGTCMNNLLLTFFGKKHKLFNLLDCSIVGDLILIINII